MNKFVASLLIAAAIGSSAVATQAMPLGRTQDSLVVLVAGGLAFIVGLMAAAVAMVTTAACTTAALW